MSSSGHRQANPAALDRNLLVVAPPGCGKTELLARRAEALIPSLKPGQRILALTFSNKAKANLRGRLLDVLGSERVRRHITIHNFHGHAGEIIRSHAATLDAPANIEFAEKHTQRDAIEPYLEGLSENEANEHRSRLETQLRVAKQGPFSDLNVLGRLRALQDPRAFDIEDHRQRGDVLFFDDLLRNAQRLLRVPEISRLYQAHYGALLVDEFQDLSPQQLDIALRSCSTSRTFVGDPLQGIYSWTGARPDLVERLLRRISGDPAGLGVSYRSSPRVLTLLGTVTVKLGGQALTPHDADSWFEGGVAAGARFKTGSDEAAFIRSLAHEIMAHQPQATIGIICRSGWRRKPIDAEFAASDTPCTRWELALDSSHVMDTLKRALSALGGEATAAQLRDEVRAALGPGDADTIAEAMDAIDQLEAIAGPSRSMATAILDVRESEDPDAAIPAGVHLLNAHTGKGQQFDWVIIPGVEQGNVPSFLARTAEALDEEHRVLLVMLSRARHGALITYSDSLISKKNKPYNTTPSPWLSELREGLHTDGEGMLEHIRRMARHDSTDNT